MKINNIKYQQPQCFIKIRKSVFLSICVVCFISILSAQTAKDEIYANVCKSASNYYAYPDPDSSIKQTLAPKDYKPFYISHYGRHGSRYLLSTGQYEDPIKTLSHADEAGVLTPLGKDLKNRLLVISEMARGRIGELTPLGALQHRKIAERMFWNFPEIFSGNTFIDARSTTVVRCILSMGNECMRFKELNPNLQIYTDASEHDMYFMNYEDKKVKTYRKDSAARAAKALFYKEHLHPERLMKILFTNSEYVRKHVNTTKLMSQLFEIASNMQSMDSKISLYDLFSIEECYEQWLCENVDWYINYGPSLLTKGYMPYSQSNLLTNILNTADSIVATGKNAMTLRFGHEVCVMPLACLMELGNCGVIVNNLNELADKWRNYNIFPMGSNIQLIFFKKESSNDILVKALLNEREVTLPVNSEYAPYYHWDDLQAYYRAKLKAFRK